MDFKEKVKELLKQKGMNQSELAKRLGKAVSTLNYYMTVQKSRPKDDFIKAVAEAFGVPVSEFDEKDREYLEQVNKIVGVVRGCCIDAQKEILVGPEGLNLPWRDLAIEEARNVDKFELFKIAKLLEIQAAHFFNPSIPRSEKPKCSDNVPIPVVGSIPEGFSIAINDAGYEYIDVPRSYLLEENGGKTPLDGLYAIKVNSPIKTDEHYLGIKENDYIVFQEAVSFDHRDIIVLKNNSDLAILLKRFDHRYGKVNLYPVEPEIQTKEIFTQVKSAENVEFADLQAKSKYRYLGKVLCIIGLYSKIC